MFLLLSHGFSHVFPPDFCLFVLMRVEISLFNSGMLGSCSVFRVKAYDQIDKPPILSGNWLVQVFPDDSSLDAYKSYSMTAVSNSARCQH